MLRFQITKRYIRIKAASCRVCLDFLICQSYVMTITHSVLLLLELNHKAQYYVNEFICNKYNIYSINIYSVCVCVCVCVCVSIIIVHYDLFLHKINFYS